MLWSSRSHAERQCIAGSIDKRTVRTWTLPAWETVISGAALGLLARLSYQEGSWQEQNRHSLSSSRPAEFSCQRARHVR